MPVNTQTKPETTRNKPTKNKDNKPTKITHCGHTMKGLGSYTMENVCDNSSNWTQFLLVSHM